MNYPYIDFHTHRPKKTDNHLCIHSLLLEEYSQNSFNFPFTLGVHPWWADEVNEEDFKLLYQRLSKHPLYAGLGEIGLDKVKDDNWQVQVELFNFQLLLAKDNDEAFVIIHCVRAFNEIIKSIKKVGYKGHLIFHDYQGNEEITKDLLKRNCYFSLGKKILNASEHFLKTIDLIPLPQILLESDDHEGIEVEALYQKLSQIKEVPLDELKKQLYINASSLIPYLKIYD